MPAPKEGPENIDISRESGVTQRNNYREEAGEPREESIQRQI